MGEIREASDLLELIHTIAVAIRRHVFVIYA